MTSPFAIPPQPLPDADSLGFWEATAQGKLRLCRCQSCGLWQHPPLERCRMCAGPTANEDVAGTGTVYSFIIQHQPSVPGYIEQVPYVVALIELDEQPGLRLPGRIVDAGPETVRCGMRVRAHIVDLPGGEFKVPVFHLEGEAA